MFGVSFLAPLFLLGALAAAVPIALHLFRRRTDVVIDFPAAALLPRTPVERHRRRNLREVILLALRVAALLLLAVSFARPYVADAVSPESLPLTVVGVDTSLSLSAPGQMDLAREAARRAVTSAPASHAVALLAFADSATVVVPPTTDRGALNAAVGRLAAGPGGTRYRTALARASALIGAREGRVVMVTDLQQAGWDANDNGGLPDGVAAEIVPIAPPRGNLAVTVADRREGAVFATVHNYGAVPARAPVRLVVGGRMVAEAQASVGPQSAVEVRLTGAIPATGAGQVMVDDPVGYQHDNVRYLVLDPPSALPIAVVVADPVGATGGLYIERALSVAGAGLEFSVTVVDGRLLSTWSARELATHAALVVTGTRTLDRRGRDLIAAYLRLGGSLLLTLGPDVDPATLSDLAGVDLGVAATPVVVAGRAAALVASDTRHPIFGPFRTPAGALGDVLVDQYRRLDDRAGRVVLARFSGGDPALVEQAVGQGRLLVFTSDLDNQWGRFPLTPAFVPFTVETARYLTSGRERRQTWVLPAAPPGTPSAPGVVMVGPAGAAGYLAAINSDARESNPAATSAEEFRADIGRTGRQENRDAPSDARAAENRQHWWQMGLLVMLAALVGESLVGRRAI